MTIQLSTAVRNALLDAIETAIGAAPVIEIRTGPLPAAPASPSIGTLLTSGALPNDWLANAANGVKALNGTPKTDQAVGSGYAGHYRIKAADGTYHIQGLVSENWTASKAYVVGQQVNNGGNVYRATAAGNSAASVGPAGTGAAITDGGVTWGYIGGQDMVLENTNVATGQSGVTLNAYSLTAPNA